MDTILVVVRPFGPHATGDRITAPEDIAATLASDHAGWVVAINSPATPTTEH
jgi:hypothetical protein